MEFHKGSYILKKAYLEKLQIYFDRSVFTFFDCPDMTEQESFRVSTAIDAAMHCLSSHGYIDQGYVSELQIASMIAVMQNSNNKAVQKKFEQFYQSATGLIIEIQKIGKWVKGHLWNGFFNSKC